jgi:hypothetical protein
MEKDIANINVDMIGCSQGAAYALATGSDDLFNQTAAFGEKSPITIKPDPFPA